MEVCYYIYLPTSSSIQYHTATPIGVVHISLDKLASTCELHQIIPISTPESERKLTGFKLEVRVRLNAPIEKQEYVDEKFTWAILTVSVML